MGLSRRNAFLAYAALLLISIVIWIFIPIVAYGVLVLGILGAVVYFSCKKSPEPNVQQEKDVHTPLAGSHSLAPAVVAEPATQYETSIPITTTPDPNTTSPASEMGSHNQETTTKNNNNDTRPAATTTTKIAKKRVYYLDNIKSILTCIVVIHHIACAFTGVGWYYMIGYYYNPFLILGTFITSSDQSYFMCLFFFISGYFTPLSYKKKGAFKFLADKFKRLGIPFSIYFWILGPINNLLVDQIFIGENMADGEKKSSSYYSNDAGPCWFVAWLLIFNVLYCLIDADVPYYNKQIPSFIKLSLYAIVLTILNTICILVLGGSFIFMPITIGSLPFDVMFFIAGTLAHKNKWLETITEKKEKDSQSSNVNVYYNNRYVILSVISAILTIGCVGLFYFIDIGHGIMAKKNQSTDCSVDINSDDYSISFALGMLGFLLWFGLCCIWISLGWIQFGSNWLNFSNDKTKFFAKSAYTVYIIHPLIVCFVTWTYTKILKGINGVELVFCHDEQASRTHFGNDWLVLFGWIYTVVVSLLIVWPLAHYIRQLPGLRNIL